MRSLLTLAATLLLLALPPAGASAYMSPGETIADPQVDAWVAVAQSTWGATPSCPEGVRLDRAQRLPGAGMWAAAEMPGCHISLDPDFYPAPAAWTADDRSRAQWTEQMCNVVVHEWGHLLGHAHVDDPHDLMAVIVPITVAACRPGATPPPPAAATHPAPPRKPAARAKPVVRQPRKTARAVRRAANRRKAAARRIMARRHLHLVGARGPLAPAA